jgi:hypothetical protein
MEFLFFQLQGALDGVEAFFVVERNREQDGFHRIVVALIGGGLRVAAGAMEETIEKFLVLAAKRAAEFRPVRCGLLD